MKERAGIQSVEVGFALLDVLARAPGPLMLRDLAPALDATDFSAEEVDAALRVFAEGTGLKLGQIAQPLRAALTGSTTSPGIDLTLAALGREETLARIRAAAS